MKSILLVFTIFAASLTCSAEVRTRSLEIALPGKMNEGIKRALRYDMKIEIIREKNRCSQMGGLFREEQAYFYESHRSESEYFTHCRIVTSCEVFNNNY